MGSLGKARVEMGDPYGESTNSEFEGFLGSAKVGVSSPAFKKKKPIPLL